MNKTISVCGSMQFFSQMEELKLRLETFGFSIYLPEAEESEGYYLSLPETEKPALKRKFIDAHLEKIKKSDAVLIANFPKRGIEGYVGANTLMEVAFAYALGKKIFLLHPMTEQPCKDEIDGLGAYTLKGDLSKLGDILE